jgi:uncharacterized protein
MLKMFTKTTVVIAVLFVSFISPIFKISSQGDATPSTISVSGNAEVRVVPDEVILILGVETSDMDLLKAKSQNDERVKRLLALAAQFEIKPEHLQTDYISIEPRYQDSYTQANFLGYWVRKTVIITLKDTSKFEDLLTQALQSGANYVHGIEFRTTELRKYRDQARALAIAAAREKAVALSKELGHEVGQPLSIREDSFGWWSSYGSWWGSRYGGGQAQNVVQNSGSGAAPSDDSTIALGQITVSASVSVSFALMPEAK